MNLKCGIVGLPNVGKSTLFNALTKAGIEAANYPFCTIEPNTGTVEVPDERVAILAKIVNPKKTQSAIVEFIDIAGLVSGANKGEGLGNKFLANIRETNAIINVVRCFNDPNVVHVSNHVNPLNDVEVIATELALADLTTIEKTIQRENKKAKSGDKEAIALISLLESLLPSLNQGKHIRLLDISDTQQQLLKPLCLLTIKPALYVANVLDDGFTNNPLLDQLTKIGRQENTPVIPISAAMESELADLDPKEKIDFLQTMGFAEPSLNRLIRATYDLLGLQTYFTVGVKEVRAWTIYKGSNAQQAAGAIHTDFERGFIRAQVVSYEDFISFGSEARAKESGKIRSEGKDYIVQDGDIIHFLFNV